MAPLNVYVAFIFSLFIGSSVAFGPLTSVRCEKGARAGVKDPAVEMYPMIMMPTHSDTQLNMIGRLFRRSSSNKKRVKTLERETEPPATKQEKKDRKPYYRVMLHSTEWQPEIVARLLPRAIPALDRVAAFELCLSARYNGKVALIITRKKQAEEYCMALQRLGLPSTIELHDIER